MRVSVAASLLVAYFGATAATAIADPADDVNQAVKAFSAAKSVHADISSPEGSGTEDMIAPDKDKTTAMYMGRQIQIIKIGADRYVNYTGTWQKGRYTGAGDPINSQMDAAMNAVLKQRDIRQEFNVSDAGTAMVGGVQAHKYHLVDKGRGDVTADVYVGAGHLPLRLVVNSDGGAVTWTYSRYNRVADFSAPI